MKTKQNVTPIGLGAALSLLLAFGPPLHANAQPPPAATIQTLASFNTASGFTPYSTLIQGTDGNFYGSASSGGSSGVGTIFKMTPDGTLTALASFDYGNGSNPQATLLQGNDGNFYGTAAGGGVNGYGTVFVVTPAGTITTLHSFTGPDGIGPNSALAVGSDGNLYGTTVWGGLSFPTGGGPIGTLFKITPGGIFTLLHSFAGAPNDGSSPYMGGGGMLLAGDGTFYGITAAGGTFNVGTVFKLALDGSLTTLASFGGSNGSYPYTPLTPGSDGNFYGTTLQGGANWCGTIYGDTVWTYCGTAGTAFRVTPDGTLTTLVSFDGDSDGASPRSGVVRASDGNFYGTAPNGGPAGHGTAFKLTPDGTLTTLVAFDNGANGGRPYGGLLVGSDGNLYGTTTSGGAYGLGTVFRLSGFLLSPNHPPVARCQNVTVAAGLDCSADASINAGSYDPDPGDTITISQSPAGPYPLGTTMVTLTVTDNHGASSSCTATVTVADTTPPSITCPANISVGCSVDLLTPVAFSVTAADNCDPSPVVTSSPASGAGFPVGTTTVNCTARDASGNQSSCSFTVTRAPLGFVGFLAPIGGADATGGSFASPLRTFKMGSTIPVKFSASCGGSAVLSGIHTLQVIKYTGATTAGTPIDATPQDAATTGDQFRLTDGQWQFNLDTKATGMSVGIWQFIATLSDGSQHAVWIQLK